MRNLDQRPASCRTAVRTLAAAVAAVGAAADTVAVRLCIQRLQPQHFHTAVAIDVAVVIDAAVAIDAAVVVAIDAAIRIAAGTEPAHQCRMIRQHLHRLVRCRRAATNCSTADRLHLLVWRSLAKWWKEKLRPLRKSGAKCLENHR